MFPESNSRSSHARPGATSSAGLRNAAAAAAAALAALMGCAATPPAPSQASGPSAADAAFERVSDLYLNRMLALTPVTATSLGDHRFDRELDDIGPTARAERAMLAKSLLTELAAIDRAQLSRARQVDAALLRHALEYRLWRLEQLEDWRWDPLLYTDLAGNGLYQLMARDFAPLEVRLDDAASRLEQLPRFLEQVRATLEPARVPRVYAETAAKQNGGVLSVIAQLIEPHLDALPPADRTRLQEAIDRARTAILQQQIWLERRLVPAAQGDFRLGATRYDQKLQFELHSPLSRKEIRARAEAELARTRSQMYAIARTVLATRAAAQSSASSGERAGPPALPDSPTPDEQQAAIEAALELADTDQPKRSEVFATAQQAFADAEAFVRRKDLVTVYPDPLEIVPMPQFARGVSLAYTDAPGPLDRGLKTFYVVAPIPDEWNDAQVRSYLREYNRRSINELTIHEAMPGHYVQLSHADRYPSPLRAVLQSGTFIEGWAVYGERLMREQSYMSGDPLMQLVQLKWYLRSIANAILDQAVHVDGMTHDEAMRLMVHDTLQEASEAEAKWARAQLSSAQLATYFVGLQEHLDLRAEAEQRWGNSFTLKRYHDAVLSFGSPPVKFVRALMFGLPIPQD